jgi:tetratricopeptide (TPR) repeat protein
VKEEEKEVKALWKTIANETGEEKVDALIKLSYRAFNSGNPKESLALCETAREEYEALGAAASATTLAHIYYGIACSQQKLKNNPEAIAAVQKSEEIYRELGSSEEIVMLKFEGDLWFDSKEFNKAIEVYTRIHSGVRPDLSESDLAWSYDSCGQAYVRLKKWSDALSYFLKARDLYKSLKQPLFVLHVSEEISLCYSMLGDGINAEVYADLALDLAETVVDSFHLNWARARKGLALKVQENLDPAMELFHEAKAGLVHMDWIDWRGVLEIQREIMDIYVIKGQMDKADEIKKKINNLSEIILDENETL